ncbi:PASK kinase, partial [Polypterus senegalus]
MAVKTMASPSLDKLGSSLKDSPVCGAATFQLDNSLNLSKSFPRVSKPSYRRAPEFCLGHSTLTGNGLNSYCFSSGATWNLHLSDLRSSSPVSDFCNASTNSLLKHLSWGIPIQTSLPSNRNPNQAILTVDTKTTEVDAVTSAGVDIPVSVWVHKLTNEGKRCVVVMEPVERVSASVSFKENGRILSCDDTFAHLHGYVSPEELTGVFVTDLIPSLQIPPPCLKVPKSLRIQRATGRSRDGTTFPLSIKLNIASEYEETKDFSSILEPEKVNHKVPCLLEDPEPIEKKYLCSSPKTVLIDSAIDEHEGDKWTQTQSCPEVIYCGTVWVFSTISGLVILLPDGTIQSINNNFSLMLFGYETTELQGKQKNIAIVAFFHHGTKVADNLIEIQKQQKFPEHKLIQAVETKWNSVFYMWERLSEQKEAVVIVLRLLGKSSLYLSEEEWSVVTLSVNALRPFVEATRHVSLSKVIPLVSLLHRTTATSEHKGSKLAAELSV